VANADAQYVSDCSHGPILHVGKAKTPT
jgi:hypothetical protein